METGVHFSSASDDWATPQELYDRLDAEFHFTLDVCATEDNKKNANFISPAQDGLRQKWSGVCWMNPPYGRTIFRWVHKAFESGRKGAVVVCLLPSRTDSRWWHQWVMRSAEVRLLRGRVKFGAATSCAPFPSAVVVFNDSYEGPVFSSM